MASTSPPLTNKNSSILASSFIPLEPEEISAEWLFEVINQYRKLKEMSLVKEADDLLSCEIKEKKSSKGRLSSTYIIEIKFKVSILILQHRLIWAQSFSSLKADLYHQDINGDFAFM